MGICIRGGLVPGLVMYESKLIRYISFLTAALADQWGGNSVSSSKPTLNSPFLCELSEGVVFFNLNF